MQDDLSESKMLLTALYRSITKCNSKNKVIPVSCVDLQSYYVLSSHSIAAIISEHAGKGHLKVLRHDLCNEEEKVLHYS